jgi:putative Mg2+ transporter-C (MgtC) family protein
MELDFIIRISVCLLLSILIGSERQYRNGMVGLRTNVLVAIGSFMFNYVTFGVSGNHDFTRMGAGIVSGMGFLGAGIIIQENNRVKGLNTAATLWCVSAIGVLSSSGMIFEACVGTFLVLFSNIILRLISFFVMNKIKNRLKEKCILRISCTRTIEGSICQTLSSYIEKHNLNLVSMDKDEVTKDEVKLVVVIVTSRPDEVDNLVKTLSAEVGVTSLSWKHSKYYQSDNEDDTSEE